jgi:hypothetical protein
MHLGPELASMFEAAGLTDVEAESWQTYDRGGVPGLTLARTYRRLRDQMIQHGAKPEDVDRIVSRIASKDVGVFGPTSWMTWGRRPADRRNA